MPNEKGLYTKEEMLITGLPYIVNDKWSHTPYEYAVLLTRTRCKQFGIPALKDGAEKPSAFLYNNAPNNQYRYVPLYDRTDVFEKEISKEKLHPHEIMGKVDERYEELEILKGERRQILLHLRSLEEKHKDENSTYLKTISNTCGLIADEIEQGNFKYLATLDKQK